jgi:transcription-repair coupling factor (superfamily II helicase)
LEIPILLITDRTDRALTLADELGLWLPAAQILFFPEPDSLFYENEPWGVTTRRDRLLALTTLVAKQIPGTADNGSNPIIVAPARAVMTKTLPRRDFLKSTRILKLGDQLQPDALTRMWVSIGYEPASIVISPGQFARRGGLLDVWPPADLHPIRIEFFGDEIETMRSFDPNTQRTNEKRERVLVTPALEFLLGQNNLSEKYKVSNELEKTEFHIPIIHPTPAGIVEYLPPGSIVLIDNKDILQDTVYEIEEQSLSLRQQYLEDAILQPDFPVPYLTWDQIQDSLSMKMTIALGPVASSGRSPLAQNFTPNPRFGGQLKPLMEHIVNTVNHNDRVTVVSRQAFRLDELWKENYTPRELITSSPSFVNGSLSEGWILRLDKDFDLHLLTDGEIFGWRRPQPRKRPRMIAEAPEAAYADLNPGDWVVHIDHGVGRFLGLMQRSIEGSEREYLCVEYAEGDQLFVPVHQADRLTRYISPDARPPIPTRLGGGGWQAVKSRVKKAVEDMADELLELYAKREMVHGYSFGPDTLWQQELEASFPYIETQDQLRVITEVKRDMEAPQPMDRLVCGDVGYGKTEIAVRAAFKAVMDGKQVAVLVPTTVLAQQHYYTFQERLVAFPVEVEMLSRFRSPQQQSEIIERLKSGSVDIVIGTHRLLSGDVAFKDLGLLIIDEEQRFGVTHKEKLKQMRTEVDVLTMTATPIPRTLYMTLTGVRDISTIDTPPEERLPIITHVGPYTPQLVRQAVIRELERGGQVFFVHNRVQTIGAFRNHLERLVPEARITVAHGQMQESELSQRMKEFTAGEVDVLLSTSIIESGLDIPNANTLIVDRADSFGLAQLYQLRGRVGRGAQRAYAYFFKHRRRAPTQDGQKRLETLAENTQLGAGFSIAMRDLEIRGAGDILGTRQHGHIAMVGFHLYTRLLAEAIKRLRRDRGIPLDSMSLASSVHRPMITVDIPLDTNIPTDYVIDRDVRLGLYRRIADLSSVSELESLAVELVDRFGSLPEQVDNLIYLVKVKLLALEVGLSNVSVENNQLILRFPEGEKPPSLPDLGPEVRVGKTAYWVRVPGDFNWKPFLINLLQQLLDHLPIDQINEG